MKTLAGILLSALLLVAACSETDSPNVEPATEADRQTADESTSTTEQEPTTTTTEAPANAAREYFDAISSERATGIQAAVDLAELDSPAQLYAIYLTEASRLNPVGLGGRNVRVRGDVVTLCDGPDCFEYSDLRINDSGLLVTFAVDGVALSDRIIGAGDDIVQGQVTVRRRVAYHTAFGDLSVLLDIRNDGSASVTPGGYSATYVGADGRQVAAAFGAATADIRPGATITELVQFELADLGGSVEYPVFSDDFLTEMTFQIPIS